jgi:hypothetical protein
MSMCYCSLPKASLRIAFRADLIANCPFGSGDTHALLLVRNVEALLVEAQSLASLAGIKAEVLEVVRDAAELAPRICNHERLDRALRVLGHWLLCELVDTLHHGHFVGHEFVEAHVKYLIIKRQRTIAY